MAYESRIPESLRKQHFRAEKHLWSAEGLPSSAEIFFFVLFFFFAVLSYA